MNSDVFNLITGVESALKNELCLIKLTFVRELHFKTHINETLSSWT